MLNFKHLLSVLVFIVFFSTILQWTEDTSAWAQNNYRLKTSVIGSAGSSGTGGDKMINGTLGQPAPTGISAEAGTTLFAGFWKSRWLSMVSDVEVPDAVRNKLFQNYPNPFNPLTTIQYSIAREGNVELVIYNIRGQRVRTLVNESMPVGIYSTTWDGRDNGRRRVATGVYFYHFRTGSFSEVRKMILLK